MESQSDPIRSDAALTSVACSNPAFALTCIAPPSGNEARRQGPILFALNVPVRITGDFAHYRVQPLIGAGLAGKIGLSNRFAPDLEDLAQRSNCVS